MPEPDSPPVVSAEAREALDAARPVLAFESTPSTHGVPRPRNLEVAGELERRVREAGAVPAAIGVVGGTSEPRGMSNALVVSGQHTESGHPVAVFGPQTGYFAPQLLTLHELQGPGTSSEGASFAGLSFYALLGRGPDYAWSPHDRQPGHHRHLHGKVGGSGQDQSSWQNRPTYQQVVESPRTAEVGVRCGGPGPGASVPQGAGAPAGVPGPPAPGRGSSRALPRMTAWADLIMQ